MRPLVLLLVFLVSACATFTLVEPGKVAIRDVYTVEARIQWNRWVDESGDSKTEIWTVDGPILQELRFITGVEDGEKLVSGTDADTVPPFRADMTPIEIVEMVEGVFAASDIRNITTTDLRPREFGGVPGFRFEFSYLTSDGLEKQGFAVGAVRDKRLHMIFYRGVKLYYYGKHKENAERIVRSVTML